jgi:hypothetical protein
MLMIVQPALKINTQNNEKKSYNPSARFSISDCSTGDSLS